MSYISCNSKCANSTGMNAVRIYMAKQKHAKY